MKQYVVEVEEQNQEMIENLVGIEGVRRVRETQIPIINCYECKYYGLEDGGHLEMYAYCKLRKQITWTAQHWCTFGEAREKKRLKTMNDKQYSELEGLRRSDLWVLNQTPLHFKYNLDNPQPQTEALLFGSAVHKYILEPLDFYNEYAVAPQVDRRTKDGKEIYNSFLEETTEKGLAVITQEQLEQIKDMAAVLKQDQLVIDLLMGAKYEQVFTWTDTETQVPLKVKADIITQYEGKTFIVDYKTTTSCEYKDFYRSMRKYGYDFQAGMYSEVIENNLLESVEFAFIAQEKTPPYAYRVFWVDQEVVRTGKGKLHNLLRLYKACADLDQWKGYEPEELLEEVY